MSALAAPEPYELYNEWPTKITYTDGLVIYYEYNNYLYKTVWTNLTNTTVVSLGKMTGGTVMYEFEGVNGASLCTDASATDSTKMRFFHLPKTAGDSIDGYIRSTHKDRVIDKSKPAVKITCLGVTPTWNWAEDYSSAKAVFVAENENVQKTIDASVSTSEVAATNCREKDKTIYTASATYGGSDWTDTKTVEKDTYGPHIYDQEVAEKKYLKSDVTCVSPAIYYKSCICGAYTINETFEYGSARGHSLYYSADGAVITAYCSEYGCTLRDLPIGTATISAEDATYTGSAIETGEIVYSEDWPGGKGYKVYYENNTDVGTATAKLIISGVNDKFIYDNITASVTFDITADYTAADKALTDLEAALGTDTLTDEATALYDEYKETLESYKADKTTVQDDVNTLTANINALKDNIVNDTAILPVYTAIDEAYATIVVPADETLTDEAQAKLNAIDEAVAEAKKSATQAELNVVEAGILADIKALTDAITDTSALKADYTEVDTAFAALVAPEGDELTEEAAAVIAEIKAAVDALKAEDTSKTELDAADDEILADIKAVADAIADTSYLKADYTAVDEALAALVAPEGDELTEEAVAAIAEIKAAVDALKAEDTSKTELDAVDDDILADIKAVADAIDDTSALKADYTEVDEAFAALVAPEGEELTEEAVAVIADIKAAVDALKAEDTSKKELDAVDDEILADIKAVADAIADTSYLKADYTEIDTAFAALVAPEGDKLTDEAAAAIAEIKATIDALKAADTSKTELDAVDDEILADIKAVADAIADTSALKADTSVADGIIAAIDETLAEGKFNDEEAIARIEEIKAEIEAIKADGNASMAEYQEKINSLIPELESLYEYCQECECCGNIHTTMIHEYICIIIRLVKLIKSFISYVG